MHKNFQTCPNWYHLVSFVIKVLISSSNVIYLLHISSGKYQKCYSIIVVIYYGSIKIALRKEIKKDGTSPLLIRVTKDRKESYIYLEYSVKENDWGEKAQRVIGD